MTASYPRNFVTFTTKVNITQDVDASHVNALQDEVTAIQRTLGINPQIDIGMFTPNVPQDFGTVGDRISAAMRNATCPVASLGNIKYSMNNSRVVGPSTIPWTIVNTNKNAIFSTAGQTTLYCPRTGQYRVSLNMTYNDPNGFQASNTRFSNIGYAVELHVGSNTVTRDEKYYPNDQICRPSLVCSWEGMWTKGQAMYALAVQQDTVPHNFDFNLGVSFVRDL